MRIARRKRTQGKSPAFIIRLTVSCETFQRNATSCIVKAVKLAASPKPNRSRQRAARSDQEEDATYEL
jgi:hypothetical protein